MAEQQLSLFSGSTIDPEAVPSEKAREIASRRADLLELYKSMEEIYKAQRREKLVSDFLEAYNRGQMEYFGNIREDLGPISRATLYNWLQAYREGGIDALVPIYSKGSRRITKAEKRCLGEIIADGVGIGRAIFVCKYFLKRRGTPSPSSPATLRRWANKQTRGRKDAGMGRQT